MIWLPGIYLEETILGKKKSYVHDGAHYTGDNSKQLEEVCMLITANVLINHDMTILWIEIDNWESMETQ